MNFIGVDLHKKTITICIVNEGREVLFRTTLSCDQEQAVVDLFAQWTPFQVVVEATASYEWFLQLVESMADRVVLAHPKKLRVIAESTRKSDKLDARVLAEFLALDMIPQAHRPTPRVREHRALVRYRVYVQRRITSVQTKIRRIMSNYNADRPGLFSKAGQKYLAAVKVSTADRFVLDGLLEEWQQHRARQLGITKQGSKLLRWILVEAAWRLVGKTARWRYVYLRLKNRCGPKKAIVAVARRVLCVMICMLQKGERYRPAA